jgi:DNA-binding CsgD family transcriptional regulator
MPPYLPFLEALGQHIRVTPLNQLLEQIADAPQVLANILPELAVRLGEFPIPYPLPLEQTRLRLYEALGRFLEAISVPHVLVLTLDDLHWADTASLDLLCYIVRHHWNANLLVVGTYREGEINRNPALDRAVTELTRQRILTKVAVDPLSADEIEALAASYLGGPISPTLSQLLYAQSEGNPFFAEELIYGWIDMGALVLGNRRWAAVAPLEHALPQSIVGALRQRFARLSTFIIDHLRIAAIIGRTFDVSLLATVEGQEVEAVEEIILEAERARLVRADQPGVFTFSHDKIRECLYAEVSTSRRQRLHGAIGQVLEIRYEKESAKSTYQLAELAFHFAHSRDRVRGAAYSQLAAKQALQSSAIKEAIAHYHIALELLDPDDAQRGNLLLGLGEAALLAGAESEAAAAYKEALTWLLRSGDQKAAARAAHGLGLAQWRQEALQAARAAFEHALVLLGNSLSVETVRVLVDVSTLLTIYMGQQAEGTAHARRALEMAYRLEDKSLETAANRVVAVNLCMSGNDLSSALPSLERTLVLAEASGDSCEAAQCCLYLMVICYGMAEIRHSYEVSLRSMEFAKRCQQQYQLRYAYSWPALLLASQGAWAEAEQALERAQTFVDNQSSPIPLAFLHQIRGFLAYQREDYVAAEQEFEAAMENQQRGPGGLMFCIGLLGMAEMALGKREEANAHLAELEVLLAKLPAGTLPTAPVMTCLALIAITLDDQERIANLYPKLLPFRGQHYWFLVDRVLGEIATLRRDWEMAMLHLSAAEATAQREGLRPDLARTLLGKANLEVARGGQEWVSCATNRLNEALVIFEELNMADAADRVRYQLRTLTPRPGNSTPRSFPANLTIREAKVLQLVVDGKSNRQIAKELGISEKTAANHLSHIFSKTASENRAAAAAFAIRHGLA